MKIMALEPVAMVNDVLCDVCSESTRFEGYGTQFGVLHARWGYGSRHDGERYEVHLCESCFFRTLSGLRRDRMVNDLFNDEAEDLSSFGRVARDDFFNDDQKSR
jgi:stress-induced morphogen